MAIPPELEELFARAEEKRREERAAERAEARAARRLEEEELRREEAARAEAPANAVFVWKWVLGEDAEALRRLMRKHGFASICIYGGRNYRWRVYLSVEPEHLRIWQIRDPMSAGSESARSPDELSRVLEPEYLSVFADCIRTGKVHEFVAEDLGSRGKR